MKKLLFFVISSLLISNNAQAAGTEIPPGVRRKGKIEGLALLMNMAKNKDTMRTQDDATAAPAADKDSAPAKPLPPRPPGPLTTDLAAQLKKRFQDGTANPAGFSIRKPASTSPGTSVKAEPAWRIARREADRARDEADKQKAIEAAQKAIEAAAALRILPVITEADMHYDGEPETLTSILEECSSLPEIFKNRESLSDPLKEKPPTFLRYERLLKVIHETTRIYTRHYSTVDKWKFEDPSIAVALNERWETQDSGFLAHNLPPIGFFEKIEIPQNSKIINIGDLHGSLHALLRILVMLYARGLLDNNLMLTENAYLIFNGDLTDRGAYSTEVCYLSFLLKVRNPEKVFIVAGNHEDIELNEQSGGFSEEFKDKFPGKTEVNKPNVIQQLYRFLPLALYTGVVNETTGVKVWQQSSHGGFAEKFKAQRDFFDFPDRSFYVRSDNSPRQPLANAIYNWGDYRRNKETGVYGCYHREYQKDRENCEDVSLFFRDPEIGVSLHNRGHQDMIFSTSIIPLSDVYNAAKLLYNNKIFSFDNLPAAEKLNKEHAEMLNNAATIGADIASKKRDYAERLPNKLVNMGLFDWRDAVGDLSARYLTTANMLWPVITCSAATSTQFVLDTACLLTHTTPGPVETWRFEPLIIEHIPAQTACYEEVADNIEKRGGSTLEDPFILYQQLTINEDSSISLKYSPTQFERPFIDERESGEKESKPAHPPLSDDTFKDGQERLVHEKIVPTLENIAELKGPGRFLQMNMLGTQSEFQVAVRKLNDYGWELLKRLVDDGRFDTSVLSQAKAQDKINGGSALDTVVKNLDL